MTPPPLLAGVGWPLNACYLQKMGREGSEVHHEVTTVPMGRSAKTIQKETGTEDIRQPQCACSCIIAPGIFRKGCIRNESIRDKLRKHWTIPRLRADGGGGRHTEFGRGCAVQNNDLNCCFKIMMFSVYVVIKVSWFSFTDCLSKNYTVFIPHCRNEKGTQGANVPFKILIDLKRKTEVLVS